MRYHPRSLSRPLHRLGFSAHRPRPQARERDDVLTDAWVKRAWPRIEKGLEEAGGRLPSRRLGSTQRPLPFRTSCAWHEENSVPYSIVPMSSAPSSSMLGSMFSGLAEAV
ncbi:winged helix-turn-helix domain-containing protein [Myxococcus sp. NMCA1]|uniref:winged helix-turn-helix domain-containing protein n=1 Tax=Myxococcus sp. NMCA1 TaxID=2996785 RepID=UPI003FA59C6F